MTDIESNQGRSLHEELKQLRLDSGWTYERLADEIAEVSGPIDTASVYRFINEPQRDAFETTVHKIQKFLDFIAERRKKPARRQRASV